MGVTDRLMSKGNAYCIVLFATILFLACTICNPADICASDIVIDPESIGGANVKQGNVLAEYGFAVFTEESMLNTQAIKDKKEEDRKQMVLGLFESEWNGFADYDGDVKEVIEDGALFENVNTGVEMAGDDGNHRDIAKWSKIVVTAILMCIMSAIAVRWSRKRYENNYNNRNR